MLKIKCCNFGKIIQNNHGKFDIFCICGYYINIRSKKEERKIKLENIRIEIKVFDETCLNWRKI